MEELELTVKPSQWMNFAWILFAFGGVFIHPILGGIIAIIYKFIAYEIFIIG